MTSRASRRRDLSAEGDSVAGSATGRKVPRVLNAIEARWSAHPAPDPGEFRSERRADRCDVSGDTRRRCCDLGPWNILARDGAPIAFIDWDSAGPVDATWELAQVAWLNVQLHDDDVAEGNGLPDVETRAHQLRVLLDAYRLDHARRERFVEQIAKLAIHEARQEAVDAGITGSSTEAIAPNGFPIMWAVTWQHEARPGSCATATCSGMPSSTEASTRRATHRSASAKSVQPRSSARTIGAHLTLATCVR